MSISTVTFQNDALFDMDSLESGISKSQNQLSTGSRLQSAADDPVAMAQVNELNVQLSASQQYVTNSNAVSTNLKLEEQALTSATNVVQSAQSLANEANNDSLTSAQRQDIATQLQQLLQQLVAVGNSADANGNFLFSGTASGTQPFALSGNSVGYSGSASVSQVQISPNQSISSTDTGSSVFMSISNGNGTFTTSAGASNTGTGSISPGTVTDPSQWVPDTYSISFTSPTQYTVTDETTGTTVTATGTYTSGGAIAFNGIQVAVSGSPAAGDTFTVAPASTTSMFGALSSLISTLQSTTLTAGQVTTQIGTAEQQLGNAVNALDSVQASVGARINAVTTAQSSAQTEQTTLEASISKLSDTDYAAATTQLSSQEVALQAAEESYASIAKLSLFNYLS